MDDYACDGFGHMDGCLFMFMFKYFEWWMCGCDECFVIGSQWYMWLIGLLWWQKGGEGLVFGFWLIELLGLDWSGLDWLMIQLILNWLMDWIGKMFR